MSLDWRWTVACFLAAGVLASYAADSRADDEMGKAVEAGAKAIDRPIVAGFERFFAVPGSDAAEGGRLLLGELGCVACHKPGPGLEGQVESKRAPVLDAVGTRVRPEY